MTTGTGAGPAAGDLTIQHHEGARGGAFFVETGGERLGEMTYRVTSPGHAVIEHTRVDDRLGGRGVGKRLVMAAVDWARGNGTKLSATCSYARAVFQKDASVKDVLEPGT